MINELFEKCFLHYIEKNDLQENFFKRESKSDNQGFFRILNETQKGDLLEKFLNELLEKKLLDKKVYDHFREIFGERSTK